MLNRTQQDLVVGKRDGRQVSFNENLIRIAISKAFCAEQQVQDSASLDQTLLDRIDQMTLDVLASLVEEAGEQALDVEKIQDSVERTLMRYEYYSVARRYILYREEHARMRKLRAEERLEIDTPFPSVLVNRDGRMENVDFDRLREQIGNACLGLEQLCSVELILEEVKRQFFNGIAPREIARAMVLSARSHIEIEPAYDKVAGRLVRQIIYREALGKSALPKELPTLHRQCFQKYLRVGVEAGRLSSELLKFDLERLAAALVSDRDELLPYMGLQTIYDRYLLHVNDRRIETPQYFWMRVAMGLAIEEGDVKTDRAIEFYEILSQLLFTSATPTLFNSGTCHPQLSSCYLSTVMDDLEHIFKSVADNAKLSKWAGGLGNDWTNVRATNAHIKGTNGRSQGVIPFLKVVSDTAVAVNQGGKRKGAVCSYLETWHLDVEEFLDLRKNTGDDRRRTHDMHTANWIPDLFMKRLLANEEWTLFSPNDVPDLHDLVGQAFEERYCYYEELTRSGKLKLFRRLAAVDLWRKMLTRLYETGHPWITWKDPSNLRSPQDHCGVVHSSNLCTEILLNTSETETAVCNLGSINLANHVCNGELNVEQLAVTIRTAVRMLDNVIDINFYPTAEAGNANRRHRPIGLGLMGFQDAMAMCGICYASEAAAEFADRSMEAISYYAILASTELAEERGTYQTYVGSKWDRGLLPIDTLDLLEQERGVAVEVDRSVTLDWQPVRERIARFGMRNSNVMAIAPTATISTIIGVTQSIEPTYKHLFVKSSLSGEFVQVNIRLVNDLKERGLWNADMLEAIKYYDGSLGEIQILPDDIKQRYATAFEIDPKWLIACAARRQKWIDMGQSLNLYVQTRSGKQLDEMYKMAWLQGLKTTYYLRSLGATQVEKSTVDINKFGIQPRWMKNRSESSNVALDRPAAEKTCSLDNPDCESCQ
ncbi:MAG: ribonucleoside-diphosphate reductase subunit alpha [Pirellulaceae bacterium]|nr:ribonucleoside-diphosphate reductase subunit alpha [Pirellulaceae bacterium]